jgi:hypothetical protein
MVSNDQKRSPDVIIDLSYAKRMPSDGIITLICVELLRNSNFGAYDLSCKRQLD